MDGDAFRVYVQQVLAPELVTSDVVIMDNLPAHKVKGVRQIIEAAGALMYLPDYSPDFNPIEMATTILRLRRQRRPCWNAWVITRSLSPPDQRRLI